MYDSRHLLAVLSHDGERTAAKSIYRNWPLVEHQITPAAVILAGSSTHQQLQVFMIGYVPWRCWCRRLPPTLKNLVLLYNVRAAQYITRLLIRSTTKGVVFSFSFLVFSFLSFLFCSLPYDDT